MTTLVIVSCNASKPVVQTAKPRVVKPNSSIVKKVRKPIVTNITIKKPTVNVVPEKIAVPIFTEPTIIKTEILEATTRVKVTTEIVLAYIAQYKEIAKNNMTEYGIPSSIILAQGILESGAGTGPLSTSANNHFGIKCHKEWTGLSVKHDDDTAQECFRKYEKSNESFKDHALFLTSRPWYAGLFKLKKDDYKAWAKGLKAAGYATDPKYPSKLIGIIERYKLDQFDSQVLGINTTPIIINDLIAVNSPEYQVTQGDTLYSISKKFKLTIEELKKKNNISDNSISIGQNLKVD